MNADQRTSAVAALTACATTTRHRQTSLLGWLAAVGLLIAAMGCSKSEDDRRAAAVAAFNELNGTTHDNLDSFELEKLEQVNELHRVWLKALSTWGNPPQGCAETIGLICVAHQVVAKLKGRDLDPDKCRSAVAVVRRENPTAWTPRNCRRLFDEAIAFVRAADADAAAKVGGPANARTGGTDSDGQVVAKRYLLFVTGLTKATKGMVRGLAGTRSAGRSPAAGEGPCSRLWATCGQIKARRAALERRGVLNLSNDERNVWALSAAQLQMCSGAKGNVAPMQRMYGSDNENVAAVCREVIMAIEQVR